MPAPRRKVGTKKKAEPGNTPRRPLPATVFQADFDAVLHLIDTARSRAVAAVNTALIELYWSIGEFITARIARDGWGKGTVSALAEHIRRKQPNIRGFSASNLWRMAQFFETYRRLPKLAALLRELSWTHNLLILGKCKRNEEREFYLRLATTQRWSSRELERQLNGALFERVVLSPIKKLPPLTKIHPAAGMAFKDSYLVEFLELPTGHAEADLQRALLENLKQFLIELGRDFCFVGSQYPVQVGGRDFAIDLLFFNRALNCLVAIELKIDESSRNTWESSSSTWNHSIRRSENHTNALPSACYFVRPGITKSLSSP